MAGRRARRAGSMDGRVGRAGGDEPRVRCRAPGTTRPPGTRACPHGRRVRRLPSSAPGLSPRSRRTGSTTCSSTSPCAANGSESPGDCRRAPVRDEAARLDGRARRRRSRARSTARCSHCSARTARARPRRSRCWSGCAGPIPAGRSSSAGTRHSPLRGPGSAPHLRNTAFHRRFAFARSSISFVHTSPSRRLAATCSDGSAWPRSRAVRRAVFPGDSGAGSPLRSPSRATRARFSSTSRPPASTSSPAWPSGTR